MHILLYILLIYIIYLFYFDLFRVVLLNFLLYLYNGLFISMLLLIHFFLLLVTLINISQLCYGYLLAYLLQRVNLIIMFLLIFGFVAVCTLMYELFLKLILLFYFKIRLAFKIDRMDTKILSSLLLNKIDPFICERIALRLESFFI